MEMSAMEDYLECRKIDGVLFTRHHLFVRCRTLSLRSRHSSMPLYCASTAPTRCELPLGRPRHGVERWMRMVPDGLLTRRRRDPLSGCAVDLPCGPNADLLLSLIPSSYLPTREQRGCGNGRHKKPKCMSFFAVPPVRPTHPLPLRGPPPDFPSAATLLDSAGVGRLALGILRLSVSVLSMSKCGQCAGPDSSEPERSSALGPPFCPDPFRHSGPNGPVPVELAYCFGTGELACLRPWRRSK